MHEMVIGLGMALGAYVLGSIPFGVIAAKLFGTPDPRTMGSGNIGFTNALRISGKKVGVITLVGDFGKGFLAGWVANSYAPDGWELPIAFLVIAGHICSLFLQFKGGKGVATAFGCLLAFQPFLGLSLIWIWIFTMAMFRYSSGAAIAAFGLLPIVADLMVTRLDFTIFSVLVSGMILYKHKDNIVRLIQGTEPKMKFGSS